VTIRNFSAVHGSGSIRLEQSKVALRPNGGFHTELTNLHFRELRVDEDLLAALPPLLSRALHVLKPDQPLEVAANLVVDSPGPKERCRFGWNGNISFNRCKLNTGVELEEVTGKVSLRGTHDGQKLTCDGELLLDQAVLARQPFRQVACKLVLGEGGVARRARGRHHSDFVGRSDDI
jgi:hypothetical protein